MIHRLVSLAVFLTVATVIAFLDSFGTWTLVALAVVAWGVWFAAIRKEPRA